METEATLQCPWCGQSQIVTVDTSIPDQRLVIDCETCCRPISLAITAEPGEILGLDATPG